MLCGIDKNDCYFQLNLEWGSSIIFYLLNLILPIWRWWGWDSSSISWVDRAKDST